MQVLRVWAEEDEVLQKQKVAFELEVEEERVLKEAQCMGGQRGADWDEVVGGVMLAVVVLVGVEVSFGAGCGGKA